MKSNENKSVKHVYITRLTVSETERNNIFMLANEMAAVDALISGIDADNMVEKAGIIERLSIKRYTQQLLALFKRSGIVKTHAIKIEYSGTSTIYTQTRANFQAV